MAANFLDTFLIMFDADTSQLRTGLKDVEKEVKILGKTASNADKRLSRMLRRSISILSVVAGLKATIDFSQELYKGSEALGVNIEKLGAWSSAVMKAGGESTDFQQSLLEFAKKFNISADEAINKLPALADQLSKLNHIEALKLGSELGLNESTITLLRKGREEVEALIKAQYELGVVTREDADIIHKFTQQFESTAHVFRVFGTRSLGDILPLFDKFFGYIQEGVGTLNKYPNIVEGISFAFLGLGLALLGVAAKAALAFLPFTTVLLPIALIGSLLILAYDDLKVFAEGGDSLIGALIDKFEWLNDIIAFTGDLIDRIIYGAQHLAHNPLSLLPDEYNPFDKPEATYEAYLNKKYGLNESASLSPRIQKDMYQARANRLYDFENPQLPRNREEALRAFSFEGPPTALQQLRNINIQQTIGDITVNTQATDAQGTADAVSKMLKSQERQLVDNFSSGVMY
jgi:hypothetical protein